MGTSSYPMPSDMLGSRMNEAYPAATAPITTTAVPSEGHRVPLGSLIAPTRGYLAFMFLSMSLTRLYSPSQPFYPSKQKKVKEALLSQKHTVWPFILRKKRKEKLQKRGSRQFWCSPWAFAIQTEPQGEAKSITFRKKFISVSLLLLLIKTSHLKHKLQLRCQGTPDGQLILVFIHLESCVSSVGFPVPLQY